MLVTLFCSVKIQVNYKFFDHLSDNFDLSGMHLPSSKCKMLPPDWIRSKPNLVHAWEQLDEMDKFNHLDSCFSLGYLLSDKGSSCL